MDCLELVHRFGRFELIDVHFEPREFDYFTLLPSVAGQLRSSPEHPGALSVDAKVLHEEGDTLDAATTDKAAKVYAAPTTLVVPATIEQMQWPFLLIGTQVYSVADIALENTGLFSFNVVKVAPPAAANTESTPGS